MLSRYHTNVLWFMIAVITACSSAAAAAVGYQHDPESDLRRVPGRLIAEGKNTKPIGPQQLLTYKLEELDLPKPRVITWEAGATVQS